MFIELTGRKFGKLAVIKKSGHIGKEIGWLCLCDCGKRKLILGSSLRTGHTKSCGCSTKAFQRAHFGAKHGNWKGGRRVNKNGYVVLLHAQYPGANPRNETLEHIVIMTKRLGRPLLPEETVHHKNGVRNDNRCSNLELWSSRHPPGARVSDLVAWAKTILRCYGKKKATVNRRRL